MFARDGGYFKQFPIVVGLKQCDKSNYLVLGSLAGGLKGEKLHRDATKAQKRDTGLIKCVAASAVWTVWSKSPSFGVNARSEVGGGQKETRETRILNFWRW